MIAKGNTHRHGARLADYLVNGKDDERAELWQLRGFATTDIADAFRTVHVMAEATKCEQPFFHVQVRNRDGETLTRQQWELAANRIEAMLGLKDQPRAIAFHIDGKSGDEHMHVAWSRIDENDLTVARLPYFKFRLKRISRELEMHFALEPVTNQRKGNIKFAPTRAEDEQARRLGLDPHALRNTIRECWDRSDCGRSFQAAIEHEGMLLARGDRNDFVVIDREGGVHGLGKRILDYTASKIRARFSDLSRDELPSVEMAQAFMREQGRQEKKEAQREKPEPVWDRDRDERRWHDAVINAAIEKEKAERKFVEPGQGKERAGSREKERKAREEQPLTDAAAAIRLAYGLSKTPQEFLRNLGESGFRLARAAREEAELSHRNAAFAKAAGRFAPEYRDGEYVAINARGHVYSLNQRTTGDSRRAIDDFMRTLDGAKLQGIEAAQRELAATKRAAPARELWQNEARAPGQSFGRAANDVQQRASAPAHIKGPSAGIWTAYVRSGNARAFVRALEERDISVAVVTSQDVTNSAIDRYYATSQTPVIPPKLREGDYVAVSGNGRVYNLNRRTTGETAERVQKFMAALDGKEFQGVYSVLKKVQERAELRDIERQAFRDLSAGHLKKEKDTRPAGKGGRTINARAPKSAIDVGKGTLRAIGKTLDAASDAFASLIAPVLTPEQIREGEKATSRREAQAENEIDFSRYTAEMAAQRQQQEQEREAARQRERGGRER